MKSILLVLAVAFLAAGQQPFNPPMPPPGNPNHEKPPADVFCTPDGDAGHACACHPVCMDNTDADGKPDGTTYRVEDHAHCRANCFPQACKCHSECEP